MYSLIICAGPGQVRTDIITADDAIRGSDYWVLTSYFENSRVGSHGELFIMLTVHIVHNIKYYHKYNQYDLGSGLVSQLSLNFPKKLRNSDWCLWVTQQSPEQGLNNLSISDIETGQTVQ